MLIAHENGTHRGPRSPEVIRSNADHSWKRHRSPRSHAVIRSHVRILDKVIGDTCLLVVVMLKFDSIQKRFISSRHNHRSKFAMYMYKYRFYRHMGQLLRDKHNQIPYSWSGCVSSKLFVEWNSTRQQCWCTAFPTQHTVLHIFLQSGVRNEV